MNRFEPTTEDIKKPEAQENHEAPRSVENPEELRQQITSEAEKETSQFKQECADDLSRVEARAEKDGLTIDSEDGEQLQGLEAEADAAKAELIAEIDEKEIEEKNSSKEQQQAFDSGKEMILKLQAEGNDKSPEYWALYSHLTEGFGAEIQWRNAADIDVKKIEEMLTSKFPEKDQIIVRSCPKCGREYSGTDASYCTACGGELKIKEQETESGMEERVVKNSELLSTKEASKKLLAEERIKIAQEIREQRKAQSNRLSKLKTIVEAGQEKMEGEQADAQFGKISEMQGAEASLMAERISSEDMSEENAIEERGSLSQLIASSEGINSLRKKLEEHYAKADSMAQKKFESVRKTVEQTLLRNNVFIVHAIQVDERNRHNENSNISQRATIEDDIDILLSLEPSISTSSVIPGVRQGLWEDAIGVVIGGGDIRGISMKDDGTIPGGIDGRNGTVSSSKEIDGNISDRSERGYNELVVNNPKIFGFYQNVRIDESGNMLGFKPGSSSERNNEYKNEFMSHMNLAIQKGMPPLIMTPDRRLFEFISIDENGAVNVGNEITPEQVALGNAGLSNSKRQEIGEQVISKNLFKYIDHQKEAKGKIANLTGRENGDIELSREEYLAYAKDNPGRVQDFPEHLRQDKEFMSEAAKFDPNSVYRFAGENLKRDMDFIKACFSSEKSGDTGSLYFYLPDDLKKNEAIAELAIESNDYKDIDISLSESPLIWGKILDKLVDDENPEKRTNALKIGEERLSQVGFYMKSGYNDVDMTEKLVSDGRFIQKLNAKYPGYKFEFDDYQQLQITRIE